MTCDPNRSRRREEERRREKKREEERRRREETYVTSCAIALPTFLVLEFRTVRCLT